MALLLGSLALVACAAVALEVAREVQARVIYTGLHPDEISARCGPLWTENVLGGDEPCLSWARRHWLGLLSDALLWLWLIGLLYRWAIRLAPTLPWPVQPTDGQVMSVGKAFVVMFVIVLFV